MVRKLIKWLGTLILVLVFIWGITITRRAGVYQQIDPHFSGSEIITYTGVAGPEDLDLDRETGKLFISGSDRRHPGNEAPDGIYLLDINKKGDLPQKLVTNPPRTLHPHGISLYREDARLFLHVVNHLANGEFVEIFSFSDDTLHHIRSVEHPLLSSPNDVVAVGKFEFYATNDHGGKTGKALEDYLMLSRAYLVHYDGQEMKKVHGGMLYANGINISNDGTLLYATETTGRKIHTFERSIESGELSLRYTQNLGTGLDNIDVDVDGNLWIGCHPKMFAFLSHARDPLNYSPSQVLKLTHRENGYFKVDEIFLNDGNGLSGSSVALHHQGELFIGVVFDSTLFRAKL